MSSTFVISCLGDDLAVKMGDDFKSSNVCNILQCLLRSLTVLFLVWKCTNCEEITLIALFEMTNSVYPISEKSGGLELEL